MREIIKGVNVRRSWLEQCYKGFVPYHRRFEHPTTHVVCSISTKSGGRPFAQIVFLGLYTHIRDLEWSTTEFQGWRGLLVWSDGSRFKAVSDKLGRPLPHFTPHPSSGSIGVNLLAQDLTRFSTVMQRPYVFPPNVLVGPVFRFLYSYRQLCTVVALDIYPRSTGGLLYNGFLQKCGSWQVHVIHKPC